MSGSLSHVNLTFWYTPVKLKLVTAVELVNVFVALAAPSTVMLNQSVAVVGVVAIVPCTFNDPVKSLVYTAIVCNALLLFIPGLASIVLDVFANDLVSPIAVKFVMDVLAVNCA